MAKTTDVTTIEDRTFKGQQSTNLVRIYKVKQGGRKVKVSIKRDSVSFQSYAKGEVWSDMHSNWNFVYSIPYSDMKSMEADAKEVLEKTLLIIE